MVCSLNLADVQFWYEPFPYGVARNVVSVDLYRRLMETWPPFELFEPMPRLGKKYLLREGGESARRFREFVRSHVSWRELDEAVRGRAFLESLLGTLREHRIDLGLTGQDLRPRRGAGAVARLTDRLGDAALRLIRAKAVYTKFEFSMLPADGCQLPHTDNPEKIVSLVLYMGAAGEWNPAHGGGTAMLKPKDPTRSFNWANRPLAFDDVEVLRDFAHSPNDGVIIVKTFNSLHGVMPSRAPSGAYRKSVAIVVYDAS